MCPVIFPASRNCADERALIYKIVGTVIKLNPKLHIGGKINGFYGKVLDDTIPVSQDYSINAYGVDIRILDYENYLRKLHNVERQIEKKLGMNPYNKAQKSALYEQELDLAGGRIRNALCGYSDYSKQSPVDNNSQPAEWLNVRFCDKFRFMTAVKYVEEKSKAKIKAIRRRSRFGFCMAYFGVSKRRDFLVQDMAQWAIESLDDSGLSCTAHPCKGMIRCDVA
jgi:hypothetical protein